VLKNFYYFFFLHFYFLVFIPDEIKYFKNLESLILKGNFINNLRSKLNSEETILKDLKKIKFLDLSENILNFPLSEKKIEEKKKKKYKNDDDDDDEEKKLEEEKFELVLLKKIF
jgi:hypothetical protein